MIRELVCEKWPIAPLIIHHVIDGHKVHHWHHYIHRHHNSHHICHHYHLRCHWVIIDDGDGGGGGSSIPTELQYYNRLDRSYSIEYIQPFYYNLKINECYFNEITYEVCNHHQYKSIPEPTTFIMLSIGFAIVISLPLLKRVFKRFHIKGYEANVH